MADQTAPPLPSPPPRRSSAASASRPRCATPWPRRWPGAARWCSSAARRASARPRWPRRCSPRRPAQGALVLVGRCYDLDRDAALRPLGRGLRARSRATTTAPPPPPAPLGAAAGRRQPGGALRARCATTSPRSPPASPLVLLLDDLHWADPASLDLLRVLAREPRRPAAAPPRHLPRRRADPRPPALRPAARSWCARPAPRGSTCARWTRRPSARWSRRATPCPRRTRRGWSPTCAARAEGNAFFLGELLRTLEERGRCCAGRATAGRSATWPRCRVPPLLRQVIDARLARLGDGDARGCWRWRRSSARRCRSALWAAVAEADEDGAARRRSSAAVGGAAAGGDAGRARRCASPTR